MIVSAIRLGREGWRVVSNLFSRIANRTLARLFLAVLILPVLFYTLTYRTDLAAELVEKKWRLPDSRFITMPNGLRVHTRYLPASAPDAKSQTLLFLHGSGASLHSWSHWVDKLAGKHNIWLLDLPGAGLTGPSPDKNFSYSVSDHSLFLKRFIESQNIQNAVLAGHSVGGEIAWLHALNFPRQVRGLILVAPTGYPIEPPLTWKIGGSRILGRIFRDMTPDWLVRLNLLEAFEQDDRVTDELVGRYRDLVRRKGNRESLRLQMRSARLQHWPKIKNLKLPVLLLWGKQDVWLPPDYLSNKYYNNINDITRVIYDESGHALPEETTMAPKDIQIWLRQNVKKLEKN